MICRLRALLFACALALTTYTEHAAGKTFLANEYGAKGDGSTLNTVSIQKAIDAAARSGGTVTFKPGTYLTGSLFLKSGIRLDVGEGVTLIGSQKLDDYPMLPTRIAGIEMTWPSALINVRDQHDVTIGGRDHRRGRPNTVEVLLGFARRLRAEGTAVGVGLRCAAAATDFDSEFVRHVRLAEGFC